MSNSSCFRLLKSSLLAVDRIRKTERQTKFEKNPVWQISKILSVGVTFEITYLPCPQHEVATDTEHLTADYYNRAGQVEMSSVLSA